MNGNSSLASRVFLQNLTTTTNFWQLRNSIPKDQAEKVFVSCRILTDLIKDKLVTLAISSAPENFLGCRLWACSTLTIVDALTGHVKKGREYQSFHTREIKDTLPLWRDFHSLLEVSPAQSKHVRNSEAGRQFLEEICVYDYNKVLGSGAVYLLS